MRLATLGAAFIAAMSLSTTAGCQNGSHISSAKSGNSIGMPIVHRFTSTTTLIEHGDTLTWIRPARGRAAVSQLDTAVFVFHGDSSTELTKKGALPMPAAMTLQLRNLINFARKQDDMEQRLGHPIR